jgi:amidohydrolase
MACQAEIELKQLTPTLINEDGITDRIQKLSSRLLPEIELDTNGYTTMGAEDMAFMQAQVSGCFIFVGSANRERHLDYGHHHPKFDFDEAALARGVALMAASAVDLLK